MALPEKFLRKIKRHGEPRTPEQKKIFQDFENSYNKAISDGDWDQVNSLETAFETAVANTEQRKRDMGLWEDDPFDVKA